MWDRQILLSGAISSYSDFLSFSLDDQSVPEIKGRGDMIEVPGSTRLHKPHSISKCWGLLNLQSCVGTISSSLLQKNDWLWRCSIYSISFMVVFVEIWVIQWMTLLFQTALPSHCTFITLNWTHWVESHYSLDMISVNWGLHLQERDLISPTCQQHLFIKHHTSSLPFLPGLTAPF